MSVDFTKPFQFATCDTGRAFEFLQRVYPSRDVTRDACAKVLDLVAADIIRIQDPMMHGNSPQIVPGKNWNESNRAEVFAECQKMHDAIMASPKREGASK